MDEGAEINAIISGKIINLFPDLEQYGGENVSTYQWFEIENEDHKMNITYILIGKIFVKEGDIITQGQKVAISDGGDLAPGSEGNLQIRIADTTQEDWKYLDLLK